MSEPQLFAGPPPEDAWTGEPIRLNPVGALRFKAGKLQQLYTDPRGGGKHYWLYIPSVGLEAPDVV